MFTFLLSSLLLKTAGIWVRFFRKARLFSPAEVQPSLIPQLDNDPQRRQQIEAERRLYVPIRISEKLRVHSSLQWQTVQHLPDQERYPIRVLVPKLLVILALKIRGKHAKALASIRQINHRYAILGFPRISKTWNDDSEFVRQRLQGVNPAWIRRCDDPAHLLASGLSQDSYRQLMRVFNPGLPLYVVNYHQLLSDIPSVEGRYLAPAIAIFEGGPERIRPLGIQLHPADRDSVWFYPDGSPGWTLAKMFFNSADLFIHEAVSHLLWTHLLLENFWIAAVRNLSARHPVRNLLAPHFHFCMNANANSNNILLGERGIFAELFSAGRDGTFQLLEKGAAAWTMDQVTLPRLFERNGTMDLPGYLYRDDALLLWQAVEGFVGDYVRLFYPDAERIRNDSELAAWAVELERFLGTDKIPAIDCPEHLISILTVVLFSVIQHTFVGAVQYEYIAYPPAMPPLLSVPVPSSQEEVRQEDILRALPTLNQIETIIKATYAFSFQYTVLGLHVEAYHSDPEAKTVVQKFRQDLDRIDQLIRERDTGRTKPYRISRPARIANSVSA